jgi:threonine 3-dehydrogenase
MSSLVDAGRIKVLDIVTHRFKFEQVNEAFDQVNKGAGKILFIK